MLTKHLHLMLDTMSQESLLEAVTRLKTQSVMQAEPHSSHGKIA